MDDASRFEELDPSESVADPSVGDHGRSARARFGGLPPGIAGMAAGIGLLFALAIFKPWGPTGPRVVDAPPALAGPGETTVGPLPSEGAPAPGVVDAAAPAPSSLPAGAVGCGTPDGWRLVTVGGFLGRPTVSASAVGPVATPSGPDDGSIPIVAGGEGPIAAVGLCRPSPPPGAGEASRPPVLIVAAWRLGSARPTPLSLVARGASAPSSDVAQLYAPGSGEGSSWGPGEYVIEVATADLPVTSWLGFSVTPAPVEQPSGERPSSP
jgi:hypothetical protein